MRVREVKPISYASSFIWSLINKRDVPTPRTAGDKAVFTMRSEVVELIRSIRNSSYPRFNLIQAVNNKMVEEPEGLLCYLIDNMKEGTLDDAIYTVQEMIWSGHQYDPRIFTELSGEVMPKPVIYELYEKR